MKRIIITIFCCIILQHAWAADSIVLVQDEKGWQLQVNDEPFPMYGMVYAFTPIGENYTYNLWNEPEDFIKRMLDTDGKLLQEMGVNVIRSFAVIPPRWVTYLYETYGIYTAMNYTFGRYGISVDDKWYPRTDYSMPRTRETLIAETLKMVEDYKDVPGILLFMLGNENNYGLEWQSNEIEDLPVGEQHQAKAEYLYSVYGEAIQEAQKHTDIPFGIVNGDIQYLELIAKHIPHIDYLATNIYRGKRAYTEGDEYSTPYFSRIKEVLDKPVLYSEFGADAYNAKEEREDQFHQAEFLWHQWQELFEESYGKEGSGNSLGGLVFEWIDEWWKRGQEQELDIHNTEGSWSNGGYWYDFMYEKGARNNMNEEWFGVVAQSMRKEKGIHVRVPRTAYYLLKDIWKQDFYEMSTADVEQHFDTVSIADAEQAVAVQDIRRPLFEESWFQPKLNLMAGFRVHSSGEDVNYSHTYALSHTADFKPIHWLSGRYDLRVRYEALDDVFTRTYPYLAMKGKDGTLNGLAEHSRILLELYSASFLIKTWLFELEGFYHDGYALPGHTDWVAEGDFFGILPETFDMPTIDTDYSKAPIALELRMHSVLEGLKIYTGLEVFRGSRPSILVKYYRGFNIPNAGWLTVGAIHEEELAKKYNKKDDGKLGRSSSLYLAFQNSITPLLSLKTEVGGYLSGWEHIGEKYYTTGEQQQQEISYEDLLAGKLRFTFDFHTNPIISLWTEYFYGGRVADARGQMVHTGSQMTIDGSGNKHEVRAGIDIYKGFYRITANVLWRTPLDGPDMRRSEYLRPFRVGGNRETLQAELMLGYDEEGASYFFNFDNDDREKAFLAASIGLLYTFWQGETDRMEYLANPKTNTWYVWGKGLEKVDNLFSLKGRMVMNFAPRQRILLDFRFGQDQNGRRNGPGKDHVPLQYNASGSITYQLYQFVLKGSLDWNVWGPETWHQEFGFTIPWQWSAYVAYYIDRVSLLQPRNYVYFQLKGRSFEGVEADVMRNALNKLGKSSDEYRMEFTLGLVFNL